MAKKKTVLGIRFCVHFPPHLHLIQQVLPTPKPASVSPNTACLSHHLSPGCLQWSFNSSSGLYHSAASGRCFKYRSNPFHPPPNKHSHCIQHRSLSLPKRPQCDMVSAHLLLHPHPLEPSYTIMSSWLPPHGLDTAHPKGSDQLVSLFCLAGSFHLVVLRSHVTWWEDLPYPKKPPATSLYCLLLVQSLHGIYHEWNSSCFFSICLLGYHLPSCWNISSKRAGICLSPPISTAWTGDSNMAGAQYMPNDQMDVSAGAVEELGARSPEQSARDASTPAMPVWIHIQKKWKQVLKEMSTHSCSVQSLSRARLFATPWTTAHQASLSITNCQSLRKHSCSRQHNSQ